MRRSKVPAIEAFVHFERASMRTEVWFNTLQTMKIREISNEVHVLRVLASLVQSTDQTENHSTDARRRSKEPRPASGASAPSPTPRSFCSGSRKRRTTSTSSSRSLSRHFRSDDQDSGTNAESAEERMGNPSPQTFTIRANTAPGGSDANSEAFHQRIPQQTLSQQLQYLQQPRFHHTSFIQPEFMKQQILAQSSSSSGSNAETLTHFMAVAAAVNFQNQLRFRMQPNFSVNPEVKQEPASP
ncbi:unnamed protein product [Notodromas monacha]|uniref:Uncharacterized protein n=1 Tax=Notodromas monacha TaxID=399045 RepID=A0A7R9BQT7_9CRUS|nr:unnamed protein product [Notodromas monacha]CAG0919948.1 unnamed protein product [Notodromas monacha]